MTAPDDLPAARRPPFRARRMVLSGRLAEQVAARLSIVAPELQVRVAAAVDMTEEDAAWADSYSGFTVPPNVGASAVRWVHVMAAGVDGAVPRLRDTSRGVVLTRTVGGLPAAVGRYVMTHLMAELHHLRDYRAQQERRVWRKIPSRRMTDLTVAVLGAGEIGAGVATVLRPNGCRVVGISSRGTARPEFDDVTTLEGAGDHLAACDALVCALPLTTRTRGVVGAEVFGRLDDAIVVNVGRGACVDHDALRTALDSGHVRHAVLDVFETEPLPAEDWRWSHPGVTVTPHVSGRTMPEDVTESLTAARNLLADGHLPPTAVDLRRGY